MTWHVAHTQPRKERWARTNLWELGFDVYLPEYMSQRRHARRTDIVARPLFPRYLFVRPALGATFAATYAATAKGVVDLVRMGRHYPTVSDQVVHEIRNRQGDDGYVHLGRSPLAKGQAVRFVSGSLCDQIGIFDCRDDQQRVIILVDLLGRQVRTRVAENMIAPATT
ncbi:MAG: transcriptional activator RfaH [Alphaproteobacteria bacterium]|nr:transcriptional activator RfaH [Alphaproteobacteria bacterium]